MLAGAGGGAQIADALRRKLHFEANERVRLSYSGVAFAAGELLLGPFAAALAAATPAFELCQPLHQPHFGAALYAGELASRRGEMIRL